MCLWLLTACLGMLPSNPSNSIVVQVSGVPQPILTPIAAPTPAPTAAPTPAPTAAPTPAPTAAPTAPPTAPPTGAPTMPSTIPPTTTPAPTPAPTTASTTAPTAAPTPAPTAAPTTAPTAAPTMAPITTTATAIGLLPVLLCTSPNFICVANPDDDTGTIAIDPRLGSTPAPSAAPSAAPYQALPISGYTAPLQPVDSAVKFPREKRSPQTETSLDEDNQTEDVSKKYLSRLLQKIESAHEIRKRQVNCRCVPAGTCSINYGAGLLDVRIVTPGAGTTQCPAGQVYCCGGTTGTPSPTIACGTLQNVPAVSVTPSAGQASFGEFPWQALILTRQNDYLAGGVLIDQLNVLTVTHRLVNYVVSGTAPNVKVRLGEWDAAGTYEPVPYQEYNVAKVFTHPSYNPNTLQYDITVLRLASAVPLTPAAGAAVTINRACLPASSTSTYIGQRCMVSGWGKNMFGVTGLYQNILKKVDVPIVAPGNCQSALQTARLGPNFVLDTTSFICAGGEPNKDSCTGDGGSGLVCNVGGSWTVVGLVSWGLGCANNNVPGAYVNVAALLPWIQQQVASA